jgi:hypothetical protein
MRRKKPLNAEEKNMANRSMIKNSLVVGAAVCSVAGAVMIANTKKAMAKRIAKKAGKKMELAGSVLQGLADMSFK